ncbi:MAG: (Fe-S)-binding protein [Polyangiaceae bacterium]|nr:(Fe-S)-binding protein [Polyangiaceae bacterium]
METVAPLPEIIRDLKAAGGKTFKYCYRCGKCDVVCPWNRVRTFSIRKIVQQANFGLPEIERDDMWLCTTCGTCPSQCPRGVDQIEVGVSLRRIASQYGVFAGSAHAVGGVRGSLNIEGNPLGEARDRRAAWTAGLPIKSFAEGMEVLYFVGCYYSYDPRMKKVAIATAHLLHSAGVDFGILGSAESCCGESIRKTGNEDVFKRLARENIKAFIDRGVKKILVSSPHCYHTFKHEYPEFMVHFEIVHMTEYLLQLLREGRLKLSKRCDRTVTYHDPCYLGRHNGIYEAPRELLRRVPGLVLVEMADCGKNSLCCGGGGGRIWMDTPKSERFAGLRIDQAKRAAAQVLATSCPYCISNFEEGRLSLPEEDPLQVKDVTELIHEAL